MKDKGEKAGVKENFKTTMQVWQLWKEEEKERGQGRRVSDCSAALGDFSLADAVFNSKSSFERFCVTVVTTLVYSVNGWDQPMGSMVPVQTQVQYKPISIAAL